LANGNVVWDINGNVTLSNIIADGGTFKGMIEATGGIRLGSRTISSSSELRSSDSFVVITGGTGHRSIMISLPFLNSGQMATIFNKSDYEAVITPAYPISIFPADDTGNAYLASGRAKQFIYLQNVWYIVGEYKI
jgi:hypothetical protein